MTTVLVAGGAVGALSLIQGRGPSIAFRAAITMMVVAGFVLFVFEELNLPKCVLC